MGFRYTVGLHALPQFISSTLFFISGISKQLSNDENIFILYIKQIFTALYSSNGAKYLPSVTGDRGPTIALHLRCRAIVGPRSPVTLGRYFAPLPS